MGYDDVIPLLGDFGRYQRKIYILLCLPAVICAFHKLSTVFLQARPDFRCQLPHEYSNASFFLETSIMNSSYPYNYKQQKYSSCEKIRNGTIVTCDKYIYDKSKYESTTVIEWDLVCNRAYLSATGDSLFMVGVMLGSMGFGHLSDKLGRKLVFFTSLVIQVIFGFIAAVAPEFWSFTLTRAIIGATTSGVFLVAYVIGMEMVGPLKRPVAGTILQMFFSVGYMLTALFAYYIHNWRHLQIAITIPGVAFFCYWWFIPESTRWLLTKNRINEAKKCIQIAAKENKVTISDEQLDTLLMSDIKPINKEDKEATILDIFKHPNLRKRSLIIFFDWFANSLTYYGLSWNTNNLGGNDYLNFVVSGAVEIPAYTFLIFTLNRWGRKIILCGCMVTAGAALLLTLAVPTEQHWLIVALAMLSKFAITASYGTIYIFSVEQFPTIIRNAGLGAGSTSARIGSVLAPIINIMAEFWTPLPLIVYGCLTLAAGCLSLVLPETLNQELPETIEDGENFGRKKKLPEEVSLKYGEDKDENLRNGDLHSKQPTETNEV